jgi:hypothetical protein
MKKRTTERMIERALPTAAMTKTAFTMPETRSMMDFVDLPRPGTFVRAGRVMFKAPTKVDSEMLEVRLDTTC